jgi:hypothetical protein
VQKVAVSSRREGSVNTVDAPAITDLNGILHVVSLERNEDPKFEGKPVK